MRNCQFESSEGWKLRDEGQKERKHEHVDSVEVELVVHGKHLGSKGSSLSRGGDGSREVAVGRKEEGGNEVSGENA